MRRLWTFLLTATLAATVAAQPDTPPQRDAAPLPAAAPAPRVEPIGPAPLPRIDPAASALARALGEADAGHWTNASAIAGQSDSRIVREIVLWLRLGEGVGGWGEYRSFIARNPGWPGLATLRRHAERAMPADLPPPVTLAFFRAEPPLTGTGALRRADALTALGRHAEAEAQIRATWRETSLSRVEQEAIVADWPAVVAEGHAERLDLLLWRGLTAEATDMLPLVEPDLRLLAEARIATRRDAEGLQAAIAAVPKALANDPGLAYERYLYRVGKGRWDEAEAFLLERSSSADALGRPAFWMERRANLARAALRRGDVDAAYALAAANFGEAGDGADYADAEWVAGFVALSHLDDPARAVGHFERFQAAVRTPISLGRAGYWLGLALERAGDAAAARAAWQAAAVHQTSFYGQLAAGRAGVAPDRRLVGEPVVVDWRDPRVVGLSAVQAGRLLALAGDEARATLFLRHAAKGLEPAQRAAVAEMAADDLGRPHLGLRIAKDAAADGVILASQYYPLHPMAQDDWPVPTEFALAIARQESEFNPAAVSEAGARGLMQLMPTTAQEVSGKLGLAFDLTALTADETYNATLGTAYLGRMLAAYDGSYILAAAAYNAGPGRVDDWVDAYGDPRGGSVDAVRWIESIPFEETRNYVMRVLESLHVYRARLEGEAPPIRLAADISGTG